MKIIKLRIDPRIYDALDSMTVYLRTIPISKGLKTKLIQDILYSYVYSAKRGTPFQLRRAPTFPPLLEATDKELRRRSDGRACRVDEFGLEIDGIVTIKAENEELTRWIKQQLKICD
jgi:hypothetical protein